jgi:hypothetical protein
MNYSYEFIQFLNYELFYELFNSEYKFEIYSRYNLSNCAAVQLCNFSISSKFFFF